ncbi:HAD-IIIA family hydrolase [Candidatus Williamhamiltonella defendens]|uniref:HAD-IIIA family hydrolase n=1 Tax=Candidatus Williamhamiltonella defendens TaxID=138072 RepID=UPI0015813CB7|nr:HAD-IIIA family hydrolase [Candidatus Hamiltonella defensa]
MHHQVAILAGGLGTRLKSMMGSLPKPMVPILDKPVLEHQIELCKQHGFERIALLVHYQAAVIRSYFGDGSRWGVEITYIEEADARGTAGAVQDTLDVLEERFLVLYADTYADIDLRQFWRTATSLDSAGTLLLHPNDHPQDSDLVEIDELGYVTAIRAYPRPEGVFYRNLVNAALYVLKKKSLIDLIPDQGQYDLAKDTFKSMIALGHKLKAYITPEYIKDMGTPDRLAKVEKDLISGLPERLSSRQPRKAVFIDRDGTLNKEVNYLSCAEQLELLPGAGEAVHRLNRAGHLAVCITNQSVLARGTATWEDLSQIHARLDHLLGQEHAHLDRLYLCPHHPDSGFSGEISELKKVCDCRKPSSGLFDRAIQELNIDRRHSWMIGDTTSDILAGQRAGVRTILLRTGHAGLDNKYSANPDYICDDILSAVDWILSGHADVVKRLMPVAIELQESRMMLMGGPSRSGKTMASQVLKELMEAMGRIAHVLPLDAWLKAKEQRREGGGVLSRYDLDRLISFLKTLLSTDKRVNLELPLWDRKKRERVSTRSLSIGPDDVLILEGVPALLHPALREMTPHRLHLDVSQKIRHQRMHFEYQWRGYHASEIEQCIASREQDEIPDVLAAAQYAQHNVSFSEQ